MFIKSHLEPQCEEISQRMSCQIVEGCESELSNWSLGVGVKDKVCNPHFFPALRMLSSVFVCELEIPAANAARSET